MTLRSILPISIALGAFAGCGLKGPLYLPDGQDQVVSGQTDEQQRKERARDSGAATPAAPTDAQVTTSSSAPPPEN